MSTQTEQDLSRREEMTVSSAAMSAAPWGAATVTGGVVAVGDLGLHLLGGGLGLGAVSGSVAMGAVAFFVLAAVAAAAVALVISVLTGGGIIAPVLSGLWHGALTFGLTGAAGTMARSR